MLRLPLFKLDAEALAILTADRFNLRLTASGIEGGGSTRMLTFFRDKRGFFWCGEERECKTRREGGARVSTEGTYLSRRNISNECHRSFKLSLSVPPPFF